MNARTMSCGLRALLLPFAAFAIALGSAPTVLGGGPIAVVSHMPVVYPNGGSNLTLNLDQGPLGSRSNGQASALVQSAVGLWNGVATSTMRLNLGTPLATDYTAANYLNVISNFSDGLNPVLFDTDGSIIDAIFGAGAKDFVLGFAGSGYFTGGPQAGRFNEGRAVINGHLNVSDNTLTIVLAHEFGHFFGLDHAQLDGTQGQAPSNYVLMYPVAYRTSLSLHEDDAAAVTALYPSASATSAYGRIMGTLTTVGGTPILGANLWAQESGTGKVYSIVSDYLLQNTGYFSMQLPPGNYTLHAESVDPSFNGGSSVGPYAETPTDISFQAPHPIAPVALGGGAGTSFPITAGCVATTTFRVDGVGTVGGDCVPVNMPGLGTVTSNPYGPIGVQNGTLVGNTISGLHANAVIQLGGTAGGAGSFAQIDFQGFDIGAANSLTIRSGAQGQTVVLNVPNAAASIIAGALVAQGGNGALPPVIYLHNASGITVAAGASVTAQSGLTMDTLGATATVGGILVNQGVLDGGPSLRLLSGKINGSGAFKGNAAFVGTFGNANNPVNGSHFLSNGLQLSPSTGGLVAVTLNLYGPAPQVLNLKVNGNATVQMPSAWPGGVASPLNNPPILQGGSRPPGVPNPGYGGGSMILQATGAMTLLGGATNNFVFPGGIALKAGGDLNLNSVVITNGWTTAGQSFQGMYFESPNIVSGGNIQVLTNNLNWVNFSTFPHAHVRSWTLVQQGNGSASYVTADSTAPHLNTYSILVEAAANGQCWVCLVVSNPVNMF